MFRLKPRRVLCFAALFFGAGVWVGARTAAGGWLWAGFFAAALLTLLLRAARKSAFIGLMALCALGGALRAAYALHPALPQSGTYAVCAVVRGEAAARKDGRVQAELRQVTLENAAGERFSLPGAYWTYWPRDPNAPLPLDGQTARFSSELYAPGGRANPHGFDFKQYLLQRGLQAGLAGAEALSLSPGEQTRPQSPFLRARQAIGARLRLLLGENAPLAEALLLGARESIPEDMQAGFREAGVAHVLAVSGLHAMILLSLAQALLRRFLPSPGATLAVMLPLMLFYCALTGFLPVVTRACAMTLCLLTGRTARRARDGLTALAAAFLLVLAGNPAQLFSAGFQMSFCAVAGILLLGDRARALCAQLDIPVAARQALSAYLVTWAANIAVMLPVIYAYNRVSLIGLLINPFVCAAVEALMLAFIALLALSALCLPLAALAGQALGAATRFFTDGVQALGEMPLAGVNAADPPWHMALAIALCLLLCTRCVRLPARGRLLLGAGALSISLAAALLQPAPGARYIQLAMGAADCAVVEDGARTCIIDCGERGDDLVSYLKSEGRRADCVILTHLHADHVLGLSALLDARVPVGRVLLPERALEFSIAPECAQVLERAQASGVPVLLIRQGDTLLGENMALRALWPDDRAVFRGDDANDGALALHISLPGATLLHMSDLSGAFEARAARRADILLCAHHGSASSTGDRLLKRAQPALALISGDQPSAKTLKRLAQAGVMVYDTGTRGAITIVPHGSGYAVSGYLK